MHGRRGKKHRIKKVSKKPTLSDWSKTCLSKWEFSEEEEEEERECGFCIRVVKMVSFLSLVFDDLILKKK